MTVERMKEILTKFIEANLSDMGDVEYVRDEIANIMTQDEIKELDLWEWLEFDEAYVVVAKCACCGKETEYTMDDKEYKNLIRYYEMGSNAGKLQDLFPKMPPWIRASIARGSNGFCICPECN